MLVQYIFADTMSHDKETNADVALANTCLISNQNLYLQLNRVRSFEKIQIRISDPRSVGSW